MTYSNEFYIWLSLCAFILLNDANLDEQDGNNFRLFIHTACYQVDQMTSVVRQSSPCFVTNYNCLRASIDVHRYDIPFTGNVVIRDGSDWSVATKSKRSFLVLLALHHDMSLEWLPAKINLKIIDKCACVFLVRKTTKLDSLVQVNAGHFQCEGQVWQVC